MCAAKSAGATGARRPNLALAACILASSLAFIDGSVVNVGLPAIGLSLHGNAADLQWVINAYLLPLSALLLLGGAAGDRFGKRRVLNIGIALFAISSVLCAAATNLPQLLAARAAQGVGAALLLPNSLAILGSAFYGEARGRAVGTWSAASAITSAVGPVLGGWLIDSVSWRAIFLINIPLAIAAIALAVFSVNAPPNENRSRLDIWGGVLISSALAFLTWGLTVGAGAAGWSALSLLAVAAGLFLLVLFVLIEKRRGDDAMTPVSLFGSGALIGLNLLTFLLYGALGALFVLMPYLLIKAAGVSATAAGAALLPFPIVLALTSRRMGGVAGRIGARLPLSLAPIVVAAGFLLLLRVNPAVNYWCEILPAVLLISVGMAGAVAPLTAAVLASVDARHTGSASGLNSAISRLGGLVATALLGGFLAANGRELFDAFHAAVLACAFACLAAGVTAWLLVGAKSNRAPAPKAPL